MERGFGGRAVQPMSTTHERGEGQFHGVSASGGEIFCTHFRRADNRRIWGLTEKSRAKCLDHLDVDRSSRGGQSCVRGHLRARYHISLPKLEADTASDTMTEEMEQCYQTSSRV